MDNSNEILIQILQTLNTFQAQTTQAINDLREEVRENKREIQRSREIENEHWLENLRRWEENKKLWEENERRWEENKKRWEENEMRWEENEKRWKENENRWIKYEINRKEDRKFLLDTLTQYDIAISEQLGDANAKKMRKIL